MLKEFKEFALKGNLIDMAVAFVMGAAFTKVTDGFINGIVAPLIGMLVQVDFSDMKRELLPALKGADGKETAAAIVLKYGDFIAAVINFLIVALVMFMVVKAVNAAKKAEPAPPPPPPPASETLLGEIRDLLKSGR
jgi:large conductance mechanosensitive channel